MKEVASSICSLLFGDENAPDGTWNETIRETIDGCGFNTIRGHQFTIKPLNK